MLTRANCSGQGMVEYGLILLLVALAVIGTLALLGPAVSDMFDEATMWL
jgi:Flp pilus assembly pilin Flp